MLSWSLNDCKYDIYINISFWLFQIVQAHCHLSKFIEVTQVKCKSSTVIISPSRIGGFTKLQITENSAGLVVYYLLSVLYCKQGQSWQQKYLFAPSLLQVVEQSIFELWTLRVSPVTEVIFKIFTDRKFRFCHWLKFVASNWSNICLKLCEWKLFIDSVGETLGPEFEN